MQIQKGLFFLAFVCLAGCQPTLGLVLLADADTNAGRPLPVLIRAASRTSYRSDSYAAIERLVVQPDPSVLHVLTLHPGPRVTRKLKIPIPREPFIALYALYTRPAGAWKVLFEPKLPLRATLPLGRQSINIAAIRECRLPLSGIDPDLKTDAPQQPAKAPGSSSPSPGGAAGVLDGKTGELLPKAQNAASERLRKAMPEGPPG